jgi:hypothetical protein
MNKFITSMNVFIITAMSIIIIAFANVEHEALFLMSTLLITNILMMFTKPYKFLDTIFLDLSALMLVLVSNFPNRNIGLLMVMVIVYVSYLYFYDTKKEK